MKRNALSVILGQILAFLALMLVAWLKEDSATQVFVQRFPGYLYIWAIFIVISLLFDKYNFAGRRTVKGLILPIIQGNFVFAAIISLYLMLTYQMNISRILFFGTLGIVTFVELLVALAVGVFRDTKKLGYVYEPERKSDQSPVAAKEKEPVPEKSICEDSAEEEPFFVAVENQIIRKSMLDEIGENAFRHLCKHVPFGDNSIVLSTNNSLNILSIPGKNIQTIVNLQGVNDHRYINKFFEAVNYRLPLGGVYAGMCDTKDVRKKRFLRRFTPVLGFVLYFFDFLFHRVCPKMPVLKKMYFYITKRENRVISRAEVLGRLYACGFEVIDESVIDNVFFFVMRKVKKPVYDQSPTNGLLIRLRRVGKDKKIIGVYKLRSMHPFSEYVQEYVYLLHGTRDGDKITDDFRVTTWGCIIRKLWIDELPMLANWFKGDLKLVGVRPLSLHKFNTYPEYLQDLRVKFKPGLVPPFYADLPKTEEDFYKSEENYIHRYEKAPFRTDFVYFFRAFYNIVFKNARSC